MTKTNKAIILLSASSKEQNRQLLEYCENNNLKVIESFEIIEPPSEDESTQ